MKPKIFKLSTIFLLFALLSAGCQKDEDLPPNHAKGKIIEVTSGCYGEIVLIEVENPKGIGLSGSFSYPGDENELITYKNAIGVPYFSKIGIPDSVPQNTNTWLYFEYRELTNEEKEILFNSSNPPLFCPANIITPSNVSYFITKIISYK
ncbi:MAG: hypothetical protein JXR65_03230 [Bacteroidales bacterium]|nr:hypothetical protein [Bacteroidales bacterium]